MKKILMIVTLIGSFNTYANDSWKNRLYCFGALGTFTSFTAELKNSINNDGTNREVYFAKDAGKEKFLVTNTCRVTDKSLVCENKKVVIKVDISKRYSHRGLWDAAAYTYYDTKVTYKGLFKTTEEEIRCRD